MRKTGNKVLFALLAGAALIFAGCGQQATGDTGETGGAVTDVGIALVDDGDIGAVGLETVKVTVNEGALVQKVELYVDDQKVTDVTAASLKPQALEYTLTFDSAKLGDDGQPLWMNGDHTLKVVVTDKQGGSESKQMTVPFNNADYVRGFLVSQSDNPKAPVVDASGLEWYGNGDVKVTLDIVNYTGAQYELDSGFNVVATGGTGATVGGQVCINGAGASPVSGVPALLFAKADNPLTGEVKLVYAASSDDCPDERGWDEISPLFGLDNEGPDVESARVEFRQPVHLRKFVYYNAGWTESDGDVAGSSPVLGTGATAQGNSESLFRGGGAADDGVGVDYYVATFDPALGDTIEAVLPPAYDYGKKAADLGLTNGYTYAITLDKVVDRLGNETVVDAAQFAWTLLDNTLTIRVDSVDPVNPEAGGLDSVFDAYVTVTSDYADAECRVYGVFKSGSDLLPIPEINTLEGGTCNEIENAKLSGIPAYYGVDYAFLVVDNYGNFAVATVDVAVQQSASDSAPPTIEVTAAVRPTAVDAFELVLDPDTGVTEDVTLYFSVEDDDSAVVQWSADASYDALGYEERGEAGGFRFFEPLPNFGEGKPWGGNEGEAEGDGYALQGEWDYYGSVDIVLISRDIYYNVGLTKVTANIE